MGLIGGVTWPLVLFFLCNKSLVIFYFSAAMWDHSSLTRDRTHAPALEARRLNHWTTREVLLSGYFGEMALQRAKVAAGSWGFHGVQGGVDAGLVLDASGRNREADLCRAGLGLADLVAERRGVKRGVQDHSCVPGFVAGSTAVPLAELREAGGGLSSTELLDRW